MVEEKNMLNKDTVKKIVKIQELLANKKDGVLVPTMVQLTQAIWNLMLL